MSETTTIIQARVPHELAERLKCHAAASERTVYRYLWELETARHRREENDDPTAPVSLP